ncbi:MAG: serine/threonine-protein kinase [Acidobacteriota bacterium]
MRGQERLGEELGRYRLLEVLGRGGAGAVYRALDTELERFVAVKVLHPETPLGGDARSRFRREARLLSQLDHPSLCKVHDVLELGDEDALVLELIEGRVLSSEDRNRPEAERLRIATAVAEALAVVHRRGILHRDLKPQNVMVRPDGSIKVLDFGLVGVIESDVETRTLDPEADPAELDRPQGRDSGLTRRGGVLGTPAFMSPEQARGERVTTASDMYSFGLLLQSLLSETPPYGAGLSTSEILERSKRGDHREPAGLRSDLLRLTQRLLSARPEDRPTSDEAADVLRGAQGRNLRWGRRAAVTAVATVLLVLGGMRIDRLRTERERARQAEVRSEATVDFLVDMFGAMGGNAKPLDQVTVQEMFEEALEELPKNLPEDAETRSELIIAIGSALVEMGRVADLAPLLEPIQDVDPEDLSEINNTLRLLYLRSEEAGFRNDRQTQRRLLERRRDLAPLGERAVAHLALADHLKAQDLLEDAEEEVRAALQTLEEQRRAGQLDSETFVVRAHNVLGQILLLAHRVDEAKEVYEAGRERSIEHFGERHIYTGFLLSGLSEIAEREGERERALELMQEVYEIYQGSYGRDHPNTALAASNVSGRLGRLGRHEEALKVAEEALAIRRAAYGDRHVRVAFSLESTGWAKVRLGQVEEGRSQLEEALDMRIELQGNDAEDLRVPMRLLGALHRDAGRFDVARNYFERQLDLAERRIAAGKASEGRANALRSLASVERRAGRLRQAEEFYEEALEERVAQDGPEHRRTRDEAETFAEFLDEIGENSRADELRQRFSVTEAD